ncbi:hypothetical protein EDD37DRAFT_575473 [Exophiala viscosa]|uniref:uncharacterized protein n=1 Tax=Exophiala viscosa TaxID=2486360 RepID=UPI00219BB7CB|nr:hypothetical protein EDD37DRAFT_575473 [Exophiala viscosa]
MVIIGRISLSRSPAALQHCHLRQCVLTIPYSNNQTVTRSSRVRHSSSSAKTPNLFTPSTPSARDDPQLNRIGKAGSEGRRIPTSSISLYDDDFAGWPQLNEQGNFPDNDDGFAEEETEAYAATELTLDSNGASRRTGNQNSFLGTQLDNLLSIFMPSHARHKKADLSYVNPLEWEQNVRKLEHPATLSFRKSTPLRGMVLDYLHHVEPAFRNSAISLDSPDVEPHLASALRSVFYEKNLELLAELGYEATDVAAWAWVFSSGDVEVAVRRYIALANKSSGTQSGRIPKFVLLQILRAANISQMAFKDLIRSILSDVQCCKEAQQYPGWLWTSRVCLVVRLLRHARQAAPDCFHDISLIIEHLFSDFYLGQDRPLERPELRRLTHIFNRFLSLIALSTFRTPFSTYLMQQNAQLALIRLMANFKPQLPLTREGYRALAAVQLLHPKTGHERTWADAKSPAWPPWRRIKSGIEQDLEYPGRDSRVMKLLRRMNQAGYTHGLWDQSAAVLAGWDTDKSPTIQTRALLMRQQKPWTTPRQSTNSLDGQSHDAAELWAARIRATRTKREAWASFCAYEKSTEVSKRRYQPYFAMFDKLLAQTASASSGLGSKYLPGDVKEVFEDPTNPRDLIYVEKELPSVDQFYQDMLQAGIFPGGSLLSNLLDHAPNIEAGLSYIHDSRWDAVTKDVLRHAEKYPSTIIRDAVDRIPGLCLAAFVWLLCRHGYHTHSTFSIKVNLSSEDQNPQRSNQQTVSPLRYAWQLLAVGRNTDIRAWNAFLKGAGACLRDVNNKSKSQSLSHSDTRVMKQEIWRLLWDSLQSDAKSNIDADLESFRHLAGIMILLVRDVNQRRLHIPSRRLGLLTKSVFMRAIYGHPTDTFLPSSKLPILKYPDGSDLRLMLRVLVSTSDVEGIIALVAWINQHADSYTPQDGQRATGDGGRDQSLFRSLLCIIRLFLEGSPAKPGDKDGNVFETPLTVKPEMVRQARDLCEPLGWPSDEEVDAFLSRETDWMARVARIVDKDIHREQQKDSKSGFDDNTNDTGAESNADHQNELVSNDKVKIRKIAAY